jgi:thermitase
MKKVLGILLACIILLTNGSALLGAPVDLGANPAERPMQSATEFIVAVDPEFADKVLAGQAELFVFAEQGVDDPDIPEEDKKLKKIPPGLLKKEFEGKEVHVRNLERYREKHRADDPVLITVEVEDKDNLQEAMTAVEMCEGVLYVDPLAYYYADDFNDPRALEQWGLIPIDAYDAWNGNVGLADITIAILDTGVRLTHEDLAASIVAGWDFVGNDPDPTDEHGHGTHVAGIAAAICDNGIGIASPAGGAKIMPVRVLNAAGQGSVINISDGIRYAADHGADIINMSLGGGGNTVTMRLAIEYAQSKGCLVVASAGNDNSTDINFPARYDGVIIAASLSVSPNSNYPYAESRFSNYNLGLAYRTIHAPGDKIVSTYYNHDSSYVILSGTSMAAPYISGMAAALKARGENSVSLYEALIGATITIPRATLNSGGEFSKVSGELMILNDNGQNSRLNYSGRLVLIAPDSVSSKIVQARVEARDNTNTIDAGFNGLADVSYVSFAGYYSPVFGSPQYTTFVQQVELINGIGTVSLDLAGYKNNEVLYLWASDPLGQFGRSENLRMSLHNAVDFTSCTVDITLEKPDSYIGPSSLPTGKESFQLQIYLAYYNSIDSDLPPTGMFSSGAYGNRLIWNSEKLQYEGVLKIPKGKVQLYYYVYYNGSDKRYPDPQPIGPPIILLNDVKVIGKLLPYENIVTFAANSGEPAPADQPLPAGGLVTSPATINREGYTFKGWYSNPTFTGAPYDFRAAVNSSMTLYAKWEQNPPSCRIGQILYHTLSEALAAARSGETITLLTDILYRKTMTIADKKITFDLSGHTLDVVYIAESNYGSKPGMLVQNGEVHIIGGGELNVQTTDRTGRALRAINSVVEITNATGAKDAYGVSAEDGSIVTVMGNAAGLRGVDCMRGSSVTVYGDAIGLPNEALNVSYGVNANDAEVTVYGDVIADYAVTLQRGKVTVFGDVYGSHTSTSRGISNTRGTVTVYGNVKTGNAGVACSGYETGAAVTILGNLTCTQPSAIGIEAGGNGNAAVTIGGEVEAPVFARLCGAVKAPADFVQPSTKDGYYTYSGNASNATATLWVKESVNEPVCSIGTTQYWDLTSALLTVKSGQTIKLLKDINYNKGLTIYLDKIIFDLNGKKLNIAPASGNALIVETRGELRLIDPENGEFNVTSADANAVLVFNTGIAEVTNATATGPGRAVYADGGTAEITVFGNVTAAATGAWADNGGKITINGKVLVANSPTYLRVGSALKTKQQNAATTTKPGYLMYTDSTTSPPSIASSIIWVKGEQAQEITLTGAILYQASTRPATVSLQDSLGNSYPIDTATDGTYALTIPTPQEGARYTLKVTKPGYLSYTIKNLSPADLEDIVTVDIRQLAGDVNGDGIVNAVDLTCLLSEFNREPLKFEDADIDGNGIVNAADLTYLLAGFNKRDVEIDKASEFL